MVHRDPDTSALWTPMVARLAREHHVVTYDVRGAGRSESPPGTARDRLELLIADRVAATVGRVSGATRSSSGPAAHGRRPGA